MPDWTWKNFYSVDDVCRFLATLSPEQVERAKLIGSAHHIGKNLYVLYPKELATAQSEKTE